MPVRLRTAAAYPVVLLLLWSCAALALLTLADGHGGYDLAIYRGALRSWLDGGALYDYAHPGDSRQLGFTYPPFGALVLAPLALLPDTVASLAHAATGAVALVVVLRVVLGDRGWYAGWRGVAVALPIALLLEPVRDSFGFGQVNLQLAALVVADVVLLRRGSRWAGVGIGLAAAVKLTPALLLVHLLVCGRRRAALTGAAVAGGATLLAALVAPATSRDFWGSALRDTSRVGAADSPSNQALSGLIARLFERVSPPTLVWLAAVGAVLVIGLWRARAADRAGDDLAGLTLAGVTALLISPISWIHHLWWVIPAVAVLLHARTRRALAAAGCLVVVFASSLPDLARVPLGEHRSSAWTVLGESALCLALLGVLALLPHRTATPVALTRGELSSDAS